jgi:hypothetical protein
MKPYDRYLLAIEKEILSKHSPTLTDQGWVIKSITNQGQVFSTGGPYEYSKETIRELQLAMLEALRADEPLPNEMRRHLADAFEYVCSGLEYDLTTPCQEKKVGSYSPFIQRLKIPAIRYRRWVDDGSILDNSPNETIAEAYGVSSRSVQTWLRNMKSELIPPLYEDWNSAEQVIKLMKEYGKTFQRSQKRVKNLK